MLRVMLPAMVCCVALADISGMVLVAGSGSPGTPIEGALVHIQGDFAGPSVVSASDGSFTLPVNPAGSVTITAARAYDPMAPMNFTSAGSVAMNGATGLEIRLEALPVADDPTYAPLSAGSCSSCHGDQFFQWFSSQHAAAGTDAWVLDLFSGSGTAGGMGGYVYTDTHDPGETGFCATCHTAMADVFDPGQVMLDEVTDPTALEGVTCVACHQIAHIDTTNLEGLNHLGSATYRFPDGDAPTWQYVWGPLDDVTFTSMQASYQPQFTESVLCASCHEYVNPDTLQPGQTTYSEWLASPYSVAGPAYRTCQDCHMAQQDPGQVCIVGDPPQRPSERNRNHNIVGSTPATLDDAVDLATRVSDQNAQLQVEVDVSNVGAGHAFPTGVSIRNAILVIEARYNGMPLTQSAGQTVPFYGSDNVTGTQPGDLAGLPGAGFARVLEGRINGTGPVVRPVLFIDAESVFSNSTIPAGETRTVPVSFILPPDALPGETVEIEARLLYRRAWRATAVSKGWTQTPSGGPIEIEVEREQVNYALVNGGIIEVPTMATSLLAIFSAMLGLIALAISRRTRV